MLDPPSDGEKADDTQFFAALQELMAYAFDECARLEKEKRNQWWRRDTSAPPGILAETKALLQHYRAELLTESGRLLQEGTTRAHQPGSTPIDIPEQCQSCPQSRTRARTGAGADQSAGHGARKGNRTSVIPCIFSNQARDMAHASVPG